MGSRRLRRPPTKASGSSVSASDSAGDPIARLRHTRGLLLFLFVWHRGLRPRWCLVLVAPGSSDPGGVLFLWHRGLQTPVFTPRAAPPPFRFFRPPRSR